MGGQAGIIIGFLDQILRAGPLVVEPRQQIDRPFHAGDEHAIPYVARFEEAVYVLHAFVKKTRATRKADIDLGKQRYAAMLELRRFEMREGNR
ncbi:MAG: hypothetical protein FJW37_04375 [Acidobacteria bacterium]|nr:hypothetical protein [Acidobacteriota bacterium]